MIGKQEYRLDINIQQRSSSVHRAYLFNSCAISNRCVLGVEGTSLKTINDCVTFNVISTLELTVSLHGGL